MKSLVKVSFLALAVSFISSCTPDQPDNGRVVIIDTLNRANTDSRDSASKGLAVEEVDSNSTVNAKVEGK